MPWLRRTQLNKHFFHTYPVLLLLSCNAFGAMFALKEQAVSSLGNAYAGTAVNIADAAIGYYNPAGLGALKNSQLNIAGFMEHERVKIIDTIATSAENGTFVSGRSPVKYNHSYFIPSVHAALKVNNYVTLGLNCTSPFGFKSYFASDSLVRYKDAGSKLTSYDISPSIGIKLSDAYYAGFGIDWLHLSSNFKNYVTSTNLQSVTGNGHKVGFHAGLLWVPSNKMRMGLAYHSGFNTKLKGRLKSDTVDSAVTYGLRLPNKIVYSISADIAADWSMMANVERVNWAKFKDYTVTQPDGTYVSTLWHLRNTWKFALGFDYRLSALTIKFGVAYEQGANISGLTTLRVPDSSNYQVACGLNYNFNKNFSIDFGYAHLFYNGAKIAQSGFQTNLGMSNDTLSGGYENSVDIIGIQLNIKIA